MKIAFDIKIYYSMKHEIIDISNICGCIVQRMESLITSTYVLFNSMYTNFNLQGWEDHTDVLQAVAMYILAAGSLCLYCWLANELSHQVQTIMLSNQT